jgi:hypothetical protein
LQLNPQVEAAQNAVALGAPGQTTPQPPQFDGLPEMFVSQPSVCLLKSQSAHPASHAPVHLPVVHTGTVM